MEPRNELHEGLQLSDRATLGILSTLENDGHITQRALTQRIGIALGLTNTLLKRAVRKGLVKVKEAPTKRFAYYVTPKGFREKSRLVSEYLRSSLTFFRCAREEYVDLFEYVRSAGYKRTVLYGMGELAEIAMLSAHQTKLELDGIIAPGSNQSHFAGLPIYNSLEVASKDGAVAVVIADHKSPQETYDYLIQHFNNDHVFAPSLLHIRS